MTRKTLSSAVFFIGFLLLQACSSGTQQTVPLACTAVGLVTSGDVSVANSQVTVSNLVVTIQNPVDSGPFTITVPGQAATPVSAVSWTDPSPVATTTSSAGVLSGTVSVVDSTNAAAASCVITTGTTTTTGGTAITLSSSSTTDTVISSTMSGQPIYIFYNGALTAGTVTETSATSSTDVISGQGVSSTSFAISGNNGDSVSFNVTVNGIAQSFTLSIGTSSGVIGSGPIMISSSSSAVPSSSLTTVSSQEPLFIWVNGVLATSATITQNSGTTATVQQLAANEFSISGSVGTIANLTITANGVSGAVSLSIGTGIGTGSCQIYAYSVCPSGVLGCSSSAFYPNVTIVFSLIENGQYVTATNWAELYGAGFVLQGYNYNNSGMYPLYGYFPAPGTYYMQLTGFDGCVAQGSISVQ